MTPATPDDFDREFDELFTALAAMVPPVAPPPGVKERLLAQINAAAAPPGPRFQFADPAGFKPTRHPGMSIRVLNVDRPRRQFTALIRLEPGGQYPSHPHDGPEECVVLEGELLVGGVRMRAGDYQRAEPGSAHADQWSDTGALLFVTGPLSLMAH